MRSFLKIFILLVINIISLSFFSLPAFGQLSIPAQIPEIKEQISVTLTPEFVGPEEKVTITLEAFGTDLNRATITWKVDGVIAEKKIGSKVFETKAGKVGQTKKIGIVIEPVNGPAIVKTVTLSPQEIDLLWEARTYTPPFYKGKAMYAPQENIVVVAMPNFISSKGSRVSPENLVYSWRKDGEVEANFSGYGKNIYKIKGSILLSENYIQVEVEGEEKQMAKKAVSLGPISPEIIFYENNPLYGILFNKAIIDNSAFEVDEKNISAFPYFFGVEDRNDRKLSYEWTINNSSINVPKKQNTVTFRNTENESGTSLIGLKVSNSENFLEEAKNNVYINFNPPKKIFEF